MRDALRAEFKKLLTVRSTYIATIGLLLFMAFIAAYGHGVKETQLDSHWLNEILVPTATLTSLVGAVISLLLMAHEYRHNTIMYTLTLARSRSYILASKIIVVLAYVAFLSVAALTVAAICGILGAKLAGHTIVHQDFHILTTLTKTLVYCEGFALAGLLFVTIIRNLTASLVLLFFFPNTIEQLLGLVIKEPQKYLPFSALQQVIGGAPAGVSKGSEVSPVHGTLIFTAYLVVGWLIAWYLFHRRDAN